MPLHCSRRATIVLEVWQVGASSSWSEQVLVETLTSAQSRGLQAQAAVATTTAVFAAALTRLTSWSFIPRMTLGLAGTMLFPPLLTGHLRTADDPWLAGVSLIVHVVAAAVWSGGLAALGWVALRHRNQWTVSLPRYSRVALACVAVLTVSAVVNALTRVWSLDGLWTTGYGVILSVKVVLLGGLVGLGQIQRRYVVAHIDDRRLPVRSFILVAAVELTLMALAFALAAALSQTAPPGEHLR